MGQTNQSNEAERKKLIQLLRCYQPVHWQAQNSYPHPASTAEIRCETLILSASNTGLVRALVTGPKGEWKGCPAVIYCHAHGNRYAIGASELIEGRPALQTEPYGQTLARLGIVAICIDMPCFGWRDHEQEAELFKRLLWQGKTLFGQMLSEIAGLMDLLTETYAVDADRISALGLSVGATHAFWLAALEPRIRAVAHLCAFADLGALVRSGRHDLHGPYMMVPGLTEAISTGEIAGLIAPRPQLIGLGADDPLTPLEAREIALRDLKAAYASAGASDQLNVLIENGIGHQETSLTRTRALAFFSSHLLAV